MVLLMFYVMIVTRNDTVAFLKKIEEFFLRNDDKENSWGLQ
jgi:hypothetical protein